MGISASTLNCKQGVSIGHPDSISRPVSYNSNLNVSVSRPATYSNADVNKNVDLNKPLTAYDNSKNIDVNIS
jgi:hypothetical protein